MSVCCGTQNGTLCRSGFCILRYLWWYAVPICDLVLGFFGTYSGTLCQSGPCILRYLWWYAVPIWSLYSSIFMVVRCADLALYSSIFMVIRCADPVSVFFDTYRNILYRSDISGQDAQSASIPPHVFSCRLEASARGRWHRAGLLRRRGDYYLGCERRRYCGRVCCLSRRRVLALPQCF